MTPTLKNAIKQVINQSLENRPILVWYDEGGTLTDVIQKTVSKEVNFLPFTCSYLAIRAKIEREDPNFQNNWLIYVPEKPLEPSWLLDYELLGKRIETNLERLLVEKFGLTSNIKIKALLSGPRGRILASNWDEVIKTDEPITEDNLTRGLLSAVFGLGPNFSIGRAVLEYVSNPDPYEQQLTQLDLHQAFSETIRQDLGFSKLPKSCPISAQTLAAALLFSELVINSGGLGAKEFQELLPDEDKRDEWADLATEWWQHRQLRQGFFKWSKKLEKKYDIRNKLIGLKPLLNVMSFAAIDEALLQELCTRVAAGGPRAFAKQVNLVREVAEAREKTIWTQTEKITVWKAIGPAAHLMQNCNAATEKLNEMKETTIEDYINEYTDGEGWWKIDEQYRLLASTSEGSDERTTELFIRPAITAYREWLRNVGVKFSEVVSKMSTWRAANAFSQTLFWEKLVSHDKPIAVFLVDALRYDLCKHMAQILSEEGYQIELHTLLSSLPSITEVGMASLMPLEGKKITPTVQKGKLEISLDNQIPLTTKLDRKKWLENVLGSRVRLLDVQDIVDSSEQKLKSIISGAQRIIATHQDIDIAGTFLSDVTIELFDAIIKKVAKAIRKLHTAGISKIVVGTDHGFILLPKEYKIDTIPGLRSSEDVVQNRRYVIGKPPKLDVLIYFPLNGLSFSGDGFAAFPRGMNCIRMRGKAGLFLHGGISMQETVIAAMTSRVKVTPEERKVGVQAEIPETVTTAVFLVTLKPIFKTLVFSPRVVRVEVYKEGQLIAESETMEMYQEVIKVRLVLRRTPPNAEVRVIDVESRETLAKKEVKIQLAGYDENI